MTRSRPKAAPKTWRCDKRGGLIHDGDCRFWDLQVCTCGLLHHLMPISPELVLAMMPAFYEQLTLQDVQVYRLHTLGPVPPEQRRTGEQIKRAKKLLRQMLAQHGIRVPRKGP